MPLEMVLPGVGHSFMIRLECLTSLGIAMQGLREAVKAADAAAVKDLLAQVGVSYLLLLEYCLCSFLINRCFLYPQSSTTYYLL